MAQYGCNIPTAPSFYFGVTFMGKRSKDFDKMIRERKESAPKFTLFGKEYVLSPKLRYDATLQLNLLAKRQSQENITEDETFAVFESVLSAEILNDLRAHKDFDVELAADIVKWALAQYGLNSDETEEETTTEDETSPKENGAE